MGAAAPPARLEQLVQFRLPISAHLLQAYDCFFITVTFALLKNLKEGYTLPNRVTERRRGSTSLRRWLASKYLGSLWTKVLGELNALDSTFHVTMR